jgi:MEMO1 family protein
MNIRLPRYAGSFYEASPVSCRHHAQRLLEAADLPKDLPARLVGGLAPHAGWEYSGAVAARAFKALAREKPPRTFVLFGTDHRGSASAGEVFDSGLWRTPLGEIGIDEEVSAAALKSGGPLRANPLAHESEHSIEVQLPLIQALAPEAKIVPITVPPAPLAIEAGRAVGEVLAARFPGAVVVGSTDLTHHGGHFGDIHGHGQAGEKWTRENDGRMIALIVAMDAQGVLDEADRRHNACGAGAIAATLAACRAMGARAGRLLEYTNSYEVVHSRYPDEPDDTTVGYAAAVFA